MAFRIVLDSFLERCYMFLKTTGDGFNPILRRERRNSPGRWSSFSLLMKVIFRQPKKFV